jgi:hypothetical protein
MSVERPTSLLELHSRMANGILVRLLWCKDTNRVFVAVDDDRTGAAFSVEVPEGERALHVFDHPYAFATQPAVA